MLTCFVLKILLTELSFTNSELYFFKIKIHILKLIFGIDFLELTFKIVIFDIYFFFNKNKIMNTAELKQNLFYKLTSITDENLLVEIESLIDNAQKNESSNWENLSKTQQNGLIDAINEMDHSDGISHETIIEKHNKKYA